MTKYCFSECLAHPPDDFLQTHLKEVAKGVNQLWKGSRSLPTQAALLAALVHDLGKATFWFQERVQPGRKGEKSELSNHSFVSAIIGWLISQSVQAPDQTTAYQFQLSVITSVMKHHGNLRKSWADYYAEARGHLREDSGPQGTFARQINSMDLSGITQWLRKTLLEFDLHFEVPDLNESALRQAIQDISHFRLRNVFPNKEQEVCPEQLDQAVDFLFGFGSLLQMDKIHTAIGETEFSRLAIPDNLVSQYLMHLKQDPDHKPSPLDEPRDRIRDDVLCELSAHSDEKLFTLTAPTGSGKTLTALDAAIRLRQELHEVYQENPRIIYCLPFTAIIDQNHDVYRKVLEFGGLAETTDLLLKHHHLTDMKYRSSDPEFDPDGSELFVETWQSELVVTTFYQFLHTIFTGRNRNLKRLPTLRRAIVILDEVQAIPPKYWQAIRNILKVMSRCLETRFILMTATKPLIFLPDMSRELLPKHPEYYQKLSRVRLVNRSKENTPLESFVGEIVEEMHQNPKHSRMIVVNYRKLVGELTEIFEETVDIEGFRIYPLSALLTPKDRKDRIEDIGKALAASDQPVLVITTQLIEAGVDLSVDRIERDLAPLDAIIQTSGRCNRHGDGDGGIVRVWSLMDEKEKPFTRIYSPVLIGATQELLSQYEEVTESQFLELGESYFKMVYKRTHNSEEPIDRLLACGQFEEVEKRFQLIEELPQQSYYIVQDNDDQEIWNQYLGIQEIENPIKRKMEFYKIRAALMERIVQVYAQDAVDELCMLDAELGGYDKRFGYKAEKEPNLMCF